MSNTLNFKRPAHTIILHSTKGGDLVPLPIGSEPPIDHVAGIFCITPSSCSRPFPLGAWWHCRQAAPASRVPRVIWKRWSCGWKKTTKAALRRQEEAMTDRQKHWDASMKALKGRMRCLSLLGKDSNIWNSGTGTRWQLAQHAGKKMLLSIFCVWANTHMLFPIHLGLAISISFTSAPSRSLPRCRAKEGFRKLRLAALCTKSSPGLEAIKPSSAPQTKWTITAASSLFRRSTSRQHFDDTIGKLHCHHFTFTCLTSAPQHASRQENLLVGEKSPNKHWITEKTRAGELNKKFASVLAFGFPSCSYCLQPVTPEPRHPKRGVFPDSCCHLSCSTLRFFH